MIEESDAAAPTLDDAEIAVLEALGTRRIVEQGEYFYREGDASYDFFVILSGEAEIIYKKEDGEDQVVIVHGDGRFLGELNMLTGMRAYLSARATRRTEGLVVPVASLRHVLATNASLGDKILTAFMARRSLLVSASYSSIRLVGSQFSHEAQRLREFLARTRIPYEWFDTEGDHSVEGLLSEIGVDASELPVVVMSGEVLR